MAKGHVGEASLKPVIPGSTRGRAFSHGKSLFEQPSGRFCAALRHFHREYPNQTPPSEADTETNDQSVTKNQTPSPKRTILNTKRQRQDQAKGRAGQGCKSSTMRCASGPRG